MRILLLILMYVVAASCDLRRQQLPEKYAAGFKIIKSVDRSRIYKPATTASDYLHYRPLDIDIWYPAIRSRTDTVLRVRDLLELLEQRANYYTASNAGNGLPKQLAKYFTEGFNCADSSRLLQYQTASLRNAAAVQKKFPMVIYLCAYNGMSYENYRMFETLASEGMIVVSISSIGRFPGDMTMKEDDLLQQVIDAQKAIDIMKQDPHVDKSRIGIIGYSWGGMAATLLAHRLENVKCIVSLEGSEFHHYGNAPEEDDDFENIRKGKEFQNLLLSMPYLRLESSPGKPGTRDSVYNFSQKLAGETMIFSVDSVAHEDFGAMSLVVREAGNCQGHRQHQTIVELTAAFMQKQLLQKSSFDETVGRELNRSIRKKEN
jgi:hypothetical protein